MRFLAGLVLFLLPAVAQARIQKLDPTRFGWLTNYAQGIAEAKRTGKPMLLVFRCDP